MMIVDTTVWADWFNGERGAAAGWLDRALDAQVDLGVTPMILTEVLQGLRSDRSFERARELLVALPLLALDASGHVEAASLFRRLRRRGVTVRGAVDCVIAQTCIATDSELLTNDRDFVAIARHSSLRLVAVA